MKFSSPQPPGIARYANGSLGFQKLLPYVEEPGDTHGKKRSKIISRLFQDTPPIRLVVSFALPKTIEPLLRSPPSDGILTRASPKDISTPVKSLRVMMLITPPIASEP